MHKTNSNYELSFIQGLTPEELAKAGINPTIQSKRFVSEPAKTGVIIENGKFKPKSAIEKPQGITAAELLKKQLPEPVWIVPDILPAGLTILAGPPKMGKSWLSLGLSVAVATGGLFLGHKVPKGQAVYLALEDTERRLQDRLQIVLAEEIGLEELYFFTNWPKDGDGGLTYLAEWLLEHQDCRLVIVDTLQKIKRKPGRNENAYESDYVAMTGFKQIADKFNIAVVLVHHLKKGSETDVFNQISGSIGLSGAADAMMVLKRARMDAEATLSITGRDVEETELALKFDKQLCQFNLLGNAVEVQQSQERRDVLELLRASNEPLSPRYIAAAIGKTTNAVTKQLIKLAASGLACNVGYGKYLAKVQNSASNSASNSALKSASGRVQAEFEQQKIVLL